MPRTAPGSVPRPSTRSRRRALTAAVTASLLAGLLGLAWGDPPSIRAATRPSIEQPPAATRWDLGDSVTSPASGVAVAPDGTWVVVDRAGAPFASDSPVPRDVVHRVDPATDEVLQSWGRGRLASPHGVDVAPDGTVWVTDVGSDQVVAFSPAGEELHRWGRPAGAVRETCLQVRNVLTNLPCPASGLAFGRPTDVVAMADGTVYVSDGYRGSRVVHLAADGAVLSARGGLGRSPGQFFLPHGIDVTAEGQVVVAERRNARLQVLDADLDPVDVVDTLVGRPYDVAVGPDGDWWVLDGGDDLDGGGTSASAVLRLDPRSHRVLDTFALPASTAGHQLAVTDDTVVVASIEGAPTWRVDLD